MNAWNGKAILSPPPDLVIETDASKMAWGAIGKGVKIGAYGPNRNHINCLELLQ